MNFTVKTHTDRRKVGMGDPWLYFKIGLSQRKEKSHKSGTGCSGTPCINTSSF
jgi:hypothetical protein